MFCYRLLTKDTVKFGLNFGKDLVVVLFQLSCLFLCLVGNIVLIHFLLMGLKLEALVFFVCMFCFVFIVVFANKNKSCSSFFSHVFYCKNGYEHLKVFTNIWVIFVLQPSNPWFYLEFGFTSIFRLHRCKNL